MHLLYSREDARDDTGGGGGINSARTCTKITKNKHGVVIAMILFAHWPCYLSYFSS